MGEEPNGLSLESLAQRLEALERENGELRHKVATLEGSGGHLVATTPELRGSERHRDKEAASEIEEQVSRKALLSKAGAAAVAAVAAGTLLKPREARAHDETDHISASTIIAHWIWLTNHTDQNPAVEAVATTGGDFAAQGAVDAKNFGAGPGLRANGIGGGVVGISSGKGKAAVYGRNVAIEGPGVLGDGKGASYAGVRGNNSGGVGVEGHGKNGVYGLSPTGGGWGAVVGRSTGVGGIGAYGECSNTSGVGVKGIGRYRGVEGEGGAYGVSGHATVEGGSGVEGSSENGYGGTFWGAKGNLRLVPALNSGPPTSGSHQKGALYMDSAANLFVCTVSGTPGTWRRVQTATVNV